MFDKMARQLALCLIIGMVALGLPFAGFQLLTGQTEYIDSFPVGESLDYSGAVVSLLIFSAIGAYVFPTQVMWICRQLKLESAPAQVVAGIALQVALVIVLYLITGFGWWKQNLAVSSFVLLISGGLAAYFSRKLADSFAVAWEAF
jgi:hypothetical protein